MQNCNRLASQSARYGQIAPTGEGIVKFAQQIEPIFARATTMGMDQSSLLRSMNTWLASAAAGGRGLMNKGQIGNYLTSFAGVVPGGNTGEFGLGLGQKLSYRGKKDVGRVPINTILASTVVSKFKNEGDVKAWLDKSQPGEYEAIKGNPAHSRMLTAVVGSIKQGDYRFAGQLFAHLNRNIPVQQWMFMKNPMMLNTGLSLPLNWKPEEGEQGRCAWRGCI